MAKKKQTTSFYAALRFTGLTVAATALSLIPKQIPSTWQTNLLYLGGFAILLESIKYYQSKYDSNENTVHSKFNDTVITPNKEEADIADKLSHRHNMYLTKIEMHAGLLVLQLVCNALEVQKDSKSNAPIIGMATNLALIFGYTWKYFSYNQESALKEYESVGDREMKYALGTSAFQLALYYGVEKLSFYHAGCLSIGAALIFSWAEKLYNHEPKEK